MAEDLGAVGVPPSMHPSMLAGLRGRGRRMQTALLRAFMQARRMLCKGLISSRVGRDLFDAAPRTSTGHEDMGCVVPPRATDINGFSQIKAGVDDLMDDTLTNIDERTRSL